MIFRRRKKSKEELRKELARILVYAKQGVNRAEYLLGKVHSKIENLEFKYISAEDPAYKAALKKEILQLRNLERMLAKFSILLELTAIKVETILLTGAALWSLAVVEKVIKELKKSKVTSIPELGIVIEELSDSISSLMGSINLVLPKNYSEVIISEEANKIIEEAEAVAEAKVKSLNK